MIAKKAKILYVEDDIYLSYVTRDNLERLGYDIAYCEDGTQAWELFQQQKFDICILDIMLPSMDGFTLAQKIRTSDHHIPILFLTAKSLKEDKIKGLTIGGDDYIVKPFSIEELVLRIEVFLKRSRINQGTVTHIEFAEYVADFENLKLIHRDSEIPLTIKEAELLRFLLLNKNKVVKREDILMAVWGDDSYFLSRSLDVFISRLRKLLSQDSRIEIRNIHGVGFNMIIR